MIISALTLAVRAFTAVLPAKINYNVHTDGSGNFYIECFGKGVETHSELLTGITCFKVYSDRIAVDFPKGTLWLTSTGMEW